VSTEQDVARALRSWLRESRHEDADRVLDVVFDQLPAPPQRPALWLARRFPAMNSFARVAAVAAVIVIAVAGFYLLTRGPGGVGTTPSPTPTASSTSSSTPSSTPLPDALVPPSGDLAVGRHQLVLGGVPFTIDIASTGWTSNGAFGINKGETDQPDSASFIFWLHGAPDNVYSDPCGEKLMSPAPARTAAALVQAVTQVPGLEVKEGPTAVTIDGRPGQYVALRVPDQIPCAPEQFYLWEDTDTPGDVRYATRAPMIIYTWIIEADDQGTLVWIDGEIRSITSDAAPDEIRQIVESIQFD